MLLPLLLTLPVTLADAQALTFSHVYGDGMVLQRSPHVRESARMPSFVPCLQALMDQHSNLLLVLCNVRRLHQSGAGLLLAPASRYPFSVQRCKQSPKCPHKCALMVHGEFRCQRSLRPPSLFPLWRRMARPQPRFQTCSLGMCTCALARVTWHSALLSQLTTKGQRLRSHEPLPPTQGQARIRNT
eukprot:SAG31_NODE_2193_length_6224_cov_3.425469_6_plen_186_part_00